MLLIENWWSVVLRGLFGIVFGVLALSWPGITLVALVILFGVYALADGLMALTAGVSVAREHRRWWPFILEGLTGVAAAVVAFVWPGITAMMLLYLIAGWALVTGAFEIAAAIRLRQQIRHEWWLGLSGLASILFGLMLMVYPGAGALAVVTLIGIYGLVFGGLLVGLGLRLKRASEHPPLFTPTTPQPV